MCSLFILFGYMQVDGGQEGSGRRKTSKYFAANKKKPKKDKEVEELPAREKLKMMVTNH